jgi:hypothetical protein
VARLLFCYSLSGEKIAASLYDCVSTHLRVVRPNLELLTLVHSERGFGSDFATRHNVLPIPLDVAVNASTAVLFYVTKGWVMSPGCRAVLAAAVRSGRPAIFAVEGLSNVELLQLPRARHHDVGKMIFSGEVRFQIPEFQVLVDDLYGVLSRPDDVQPEQPPSATSWEPDVPILSPFGRPAQSSSQAAPELPYPAEPSATPALEPVGAAESAAEHSFLRPTGASLSVTDMLQLHPRNHHGDAGVDPLPQADELVDISTFAPRRATRGRPFLVQVFAHRPAGADADRARAAALASDPTTQHRNVVTLEIPLNFGARIDVVLSAPGLENEESVQRLIWRGRPQSVSFLLHVPPDFEEPLAHLRVVVTHEGVPVGQTRFVIEVAIAQVSEPLVPAGDTAQRFRRAFLSYASPDRAEVLKRAQSLTAARIEFFQDLLSLAPGERWEKRLYSEIDACDLFLLFWSTAARRSEWVMREVEHAIARARREGAGRPEIMPVVLEGPPPPEPPENLRHLHFNDPLSYIIAALDRA